MANNNLGKNRLFRALQHGLSTLKEGVARTSAEWHKFSEGGHVLVEKAFGLPDWRFERSKTGVVDDTAPNTAAPGDAQVFKAYGFAGLCGYLEFTGGTNPTATLELWAFDTENKKWFLVTTKAGVGDFEEARFEEQVRGRAVWIRFKDIAGNPTSFVFRGCGE